MSAQPPSISSTVARTVSAGALVPDRDQAARFLALLDNRAEAFTFQAFAEGEAKKTDAVRPWMASGRFVDIAPALNKLNSLGAGAFVTINETDLLGRKADNIVRIRAVFADIDHDPDGSKRKAIMAASLPPHMVVESSLDKTHAYWLVDGLDLAAFRSIQKAISQRFGGDAAVCDPSRVMRIPGYYHQKGEPILTRIHHATCDPPYSAERVLKAFPPLAVAQFNAHASQLAEAPAETIDTETTRDLRSALLSMRSDDRALWIKLGCALRGLGDVGRGLWLNWSSTSEAHRPDDDARTWDGLGHDRIGYRAVFTEAQRHGWVNPRSSLSTATPANAAPRAVVTVDANALLTHAFPPREMFLSPWLESQSLSMIYAWRGVGKTHVALGIAHALASGGDFLGWKVAFPIPVLYLDGEMPGASLRDRLARTMSSSEKTISAGFLNFVTPDLQPEGVMPNLADRHGQDAIEAVLGDAKVIIVDNLSCLARGGKENEAEGWLPLAEWSLRMRATGRSVIFIHHSGKNGQQRGTSKREDLLDTVISLKRPGDYRAEQGARFEIHFEKARALYGQDVAPLEATLESTPDRRQVWTSKTVEDVADVQMIELAELGLSQAEIARELNCHRSTVLRALRKAELEGRYSPKPAKRSSKTSATSDGGDLDSATLLDGVRVANPQARNTQQPPRNAPTQQPRT